MENSCSLCPCSARFVHVSNANTSFCSFCTRGTSTGSRKKWWTWWVTTGRLAPAFPQWLSPPLKTTLFRREKRERRRSGHERRRARVRAEENRDSQWRQHGRRPNYIRLSDPDPSSSSLQTPTPSDRTATEKKAGARSGDYSGKSHFRAGGLRGPAASKSGARTGVRWRLGPN